MEKEFYWDVTVEGREYRVSCTDKGNRFALYVDGQYRRDVPIDRELDREEDLILGSKCCRFVVYGGVPDLAVDGILLNAEAELLREEKKSRRNGMLGGVFLVGMGTMAMYTWTMMEMAGEVYPGRALVPVFALGFLIGGIWQIIRMRKRGAV